MAKPLESQASVVRGVPANVLAIKGNDTLSTVRSRMLMNIADDTMARARHADAGIFVVAASDVSAVVVTATKVQGLTLPVSTVLDPVTLARVTSRVRELVVEAVEAAAALVGCPEVASRWNDPSALDGMTVGGLCAHLVRAAGAVPAYLDRTDPSARSADELLTPVTYFHAAIDSPIHERIKEVSASEATAGPAELAAKCAALAVSMHSRFAAEPPDRLVAALGGRMLSLDDFCRTRLIEVLLHVDDLAASVGVPRPATSPEGPAIVIDILIGIARNQHGDWAMLHALARDERRSVNVFPVF